MPDFDQLCRTIITAGADAVLYADAGGVIRFWNNGARRIFGFSSEEAVGQSLDIIIPQNLRARHWSGFRYTTTTGESRYGSGNVLAVPGMRKDGSRVSLEFTVVPVPNDTSGLAGIAAVVRDVSQRFDEMKELRARVAAQAKEPS